MTTRDFALTGWIFIAALLALLSTLVPSQAAFRNLHVLADGNVRFDGGPELNLQQLQNEVRQMSISHPCPQIHVQPDPQASYATVSAVMKAFQKVGCVDTGTYGIQR